MTCWQVWLIQPRMPLACFAARAHCWPVFKVVHQDPRSFSHKLLPHGQPPVHSGVWDYCCPFADFISLCWTSRDSCCPFLQVIQVPLNGTHLSGVPGSLPDFLSSANLLKVCSVPLSGSWMKTLNNIGTNSNCWRTPLVTSHQLCAADYNLLSLAGHPEFFFFFYYSLTLFVKMRTKKLRKK